MFINPLDKFYIPLLLYGSEAQTISLRNSRETESIIQIEEMLFEVKGCK